MVVVFLAHLLFFPHVTLNIGASTVTSARQQQLMGFVGMENFGVKNGIDGIQ